MACASCKRDMAKVAGKGRKNRRRRSKISGFNMKNSGSVLTTVGGTIAGVVAARYLNSMEFVNSNPILKAVAPIAAGVGLGMVGGRSGIVQNVANGMFIEGGTEVIKQFLPDVASKVGLAGTPFRSYLTPGVAGNSSPGVFI